LLLQLAVFVVSLGVPLTAARVFTVSSERIGLYLGMSPFAVGVLLVSTRTSLRR
jgi:cation:H+ antiporter